MSDDPVTRARALLAAATPGPWRVEPDDGVVIEDNTARMLARVFGPGSHPWVRANAALIAAAPELLAELCDEIERPRTWYELIKLLETHYPEDIFPTLADDPKRDPGPRIVSLMRELDAARTEIARLRSEVESLQQERMALAIRQAKATGEPVGVPPEAPRMFVVAQTEPLDDGTTPEGNALVDGYLSAASQTRREVVYGDELAQLRAEVERLRAIVTPGPDSTREYADLLIRITSTWQRYVEQSHVDMSRWRSSNDVAEEDREDLSDHEVVAICIREKQRELTRLRAIEAAARRVMQVTDDDAACDHDSYYLSIPAMDALKAALEKP